jgi:hypothetical protein
MGTTRTERAIDEMDTDGGDFETGCDDIRLAWLARELNESPATGSDFDALWSDR